MQLHQTNITGLPFEAARFDVIIAVHVLHLVEAWQRAIREARRVLRPSGEAIFMAYNRWSWVNALALVGGTSLGREARTVHALLAAGDLPGARQRLTHLVGRDTSALDAAEVSRAVVESVAENTSDAVVAPLVWGALLGVPGLLGYRVVNTLDAMVGHRGERYGRFGWASARFDDLLNLPGARLSRAGASGGRR